MCVHAATVFDFRSTHRLPLGAMTRRAVHVFCICHASRADMRMRKSADGRVEDQRNDSSYVPQGRASIEE
eukprot:2992330-Alexandrium_andersonii.AAC.1